MIKARVCLILMAYLAFCARYGESLKIGAFNIQIFGQTKSEKPQVMEVLVKILQRYDIMLVQEIRDSEGTAIERLLNAVNEKEKSNPFRMVISERLGRGTSKEQYAFFYRPGSGLDVKSSYVYPDTKDVFEREPFIVHFTSKRTKLESFVLGGNHIRPDTAETEIDHLKDVFTDVRVRLGIDDVMMMGDMNADCGYVTKTEFKEVELRHDPKYKWWIGDDADTTVAASSCAYDRFISIGQGFLDGIDPKSVSVFRFDTAYNIPLEGQFEANDVSDHYPIEFELFVGPASRLLVVTDIRLAVIGTSLSTSKTYQLDQHLNVRLVVDPEKSTLSEPLPVAVLGLDQRHCLRTVLEKQLIRSPIILTPLARKYKAIQRTQVEFLYNPDDLSRIKISCQKILPQLIYDL